MLSPISKNKALVIYKVWSILFHRRKSQWMLKTMEKLIRFIFITTLLVAFIPSLSFAANVKGIYLSQLTAQNSKRVQYLIDNAKEVGIDTFIVDYEHPSKNYAANIQRIKDSGIRYIARITVFPGGATPDQITSDEYLDKRLEQVKEAIALGASEIQLDYIRYKPTQKPSDQNAEQIASVIQFFKDHVDEAKVPLQIDVFGISTFKPSLYIGQNLKLFSEKVDALCPMVYPSHYEPYLEHARQPYKTVYSSIMALKKQIEPNPNNVKVYAYIELFNYRYPMNHSVRKDYIRAQLKAVQDSGANGWFAWSAGNRYDILFDVLKQQAQQAPQPQQSQQPQKQLAQN